VFSESVLALPLPAPPGSVAPATPTLPDLDFVASVRQTIRCLLEVLGYTDAANFTRAFRRWAGMSPMAYRRVTAQLGTGLGLGHRRFSRGVLPATPHE
jgi:hypothetical protein